MKFKLIFVFFFILSCDPQLSSLNPKKPYTAKGFAYIYNDHDFDNKTIKRKMNNDEIHISQQNIKTGALIKISNPSNQKSLVLKNMKRIKYPDFYKILISKRVAEELNLSKNLPIVEIIEIKKNKSFVAKKAKIHDDEKKIPSKAPIASVQISNISKNKVKKFEKEQNKIYLLIATFYSVDNANLLKKRITDELIDYDNKKLKIEKINLKETQVISGPYSSVNLLKNDYIKFKNFGFEELDIYINE